MKNSLNKIFKFTSVIFIIILLSSFIVKDLIYFPVTAWKAPASANKLKNPMKANTKATLAGKKLYIQLCAICHGKKGKGDGMAGMSLNPRPADFTLEKNQRQTDGAIYWKITEGRAPMASYKASLKPNQRWELVNFIRTFRKNKPKVATQKSPQETVEEKALRLKNEKNTKFNRLIKKGDELVKTKEYNAARIAFNEALSLKSVDSTTSFKLKNLELLTIEKEKRDVLKKEIKTELKEELKEEILRELRDTLK